MKKSQQRLVYAGAVGALALAAAYAYYASLVPATHPDHDHGILNLDAGGRLLVTKRDGTSKNLVGPPGHPLVIHFFAPSVPDAGAELKELFAFQATEIAKGAEFVLIARETDFPKLDSWLAAQQITPPDASQLVIDPHGATTEKLNCKRPLETMFFNPLGKLSTQARGRLDWRLIAPSHMEKAKAGETIE